MATLVFTGISIYIGIIIGLILSVIGLFFGNIILFDSIALAIISFTLSKGLLGIHPAFALLIGLAVFFELIFLQTTRFGFWIIGGLLSAFWAFVFAFLAWDITGKDMIWFYVVMGLGMAVMIGLHKRALEQLE